MRTNYLLIALTIFSGTITAQNVGIGTPMPAEKLDVNGKTKTTNFQMTAGAAAGRILQSDESGNASWVASPFGSTHGGGLIPFSTGIVLNGASVTSSAPILMGFGNNTVEVIDGSGESTMPPEAGGFSFIVPFSGTIQNLTISADLLVVFPGSININGLTYHFTVFQSPSTLDGFGHFTIPYTTTALTSSVTFGGPAGPMFPFTYYSATNINTGSLVVIAGDRIGVRVRTDPSTDSSTPEISQLSFNASLFYTY